MDGGNQGTEKLSESWELRFYNIHDIYFNLTLSFLTHLD